MPQAVQMNAGMVSPIRPLTRGIVKTSIPSLGQLAGLTFGQLLPICPGQRTLSDGPGQVRFVHVWMALGWQEKFHVAGLVGAAMCSAVGTVHVTAGHNAPSGSGPGQQHAFDDAMAQVGCPDLLVDMMLHCDLQGYMGESAACAYASALSRASVARSSGS